MRGYVIATSPRSGSNFLCELLSSSGELGRPQDWFNGPGLRQREDAAYPLEAEAQLQLVLTRGATSNGIYGLKMFCQRFDSLAGVDWVRRLPDLRWIYLARRDLLGQAISDVRADQTKQFRSTADALGEARYDAGAILRSMQRAAEDHARWSLYFARNAIRPAYLAYEDVTAAPQTAVDRVARLMRLSPPPAIDLTKLILTIQRDAISDEWRIRYLEEAGGLDRLDLLTPKLGSKAYRWWKRIWTRPYRGAR